MCLLLNIFPYVSETSKVKSYFNQRKPTITSPLFKAMHE